MAKFIVFRLLTVIPVMFVISLFVFLMVHFAPGDPVTLMSGHNPITIEQEQAIRQELGLLDPLPVQFIKWWVNALRGDFGQSFSSRRSISGLIADRLPATLELAFFSMIIALAIGIPAGIISAYKRYTLFDHASMLVALAGVSFPNFWLGLMAIYVFGVVLRWLPISGRLGVGLEPVTVTGFVLLDSLLAGNGAAFADGLRHLILPALVLGLVQTAFLARMTRSCMLEVLSEDYLVTARAKGLAETAVVMKHALRNALIPIATIVGLQLGYMLGGAVIIEAVFSWPGIGKLLVDAVLGRDYPTAQAAIMLTAGIFFIINACVDMLYAVLDPQIRVS